MSIKDRLRRWLGGCDKMEHQRLLAYIQEQKRMIEDSEQNRDNFRKKYETLLKEYKEQVTLLAAQRDDWRKQWENTQGKLEYVEKELDEYIKKANDFEERMEKKNQRLFNQKEEINRLLNKLASFKK